MVSLGRFENPIIIGDFGTLTLDYHYFTIDFCLVNFKNWFGLHIIRRNYYSTVFRMAKKFANICKQDLSSCRFCHGFTSYQNHWRSGILRDRFFLCSTRSTISVQIQFCKYGWIFQFLGISNIFFVFYTYIDFVDVSMFSSLSKSDFSILI